MDTLRPAGSCIRRYFSSTYQTALPYYSITQRGKTTPKLPDGIAKYLNQSEPTYQQSKPRARPTIELISSRIDELLQEWKGRTTRKQRITGSRVHRQLECHSRSTGRGSTCASCVEPSLSRYRSGSSVTEYRRFQDTCCKAATRARLV